MTVNIHKNKQERGRWSWHYDELSRFKNTNLRKKDEGTDRVCGENRHFAFIDLSR